MASQYMQPTARQHAEEDRHVFVSGAGGFIGGHITKRLLTWGFTVHGTVRNVKDAKKRYDWLYAFETKPDQLQLFPADLYNFESDWRAGVKGCQFAIHTLNLMPETNKPDGTENTTDDDFIIPAKHAMEKILDACRAEKVQRVIYLSTIGAMNWELWDKDCAPKNDVIISTGDDWTPLTHDKYVPSYIKAKTVCERQFWDYVDKYEKPFEAVTCHPTLVIGPVLHARANGSLRVISAILTGEFPFQFDIHWSLTDVRDIAAGLHLALLAPKADGQRHLFSGEGMWQKDLAALIHDKYAHRGFMVNKAVGPSWIPRTVALWDHVVRDFVVSILEKVRFVDQTPSRKNIGLIYTPAYYTIIDSCEALIEHELVAQPSPMARMFVTTAFSAMKYGAMAFGVHYLNKKGYLDGVKGTVGDATEELKKQLGL
jgi:nucleoside-diphosphate-sugar epimerase